MALVLEAMDVAVIEFWQFASSATASNGFLTEVLACIFVDELITLGTGAAKQPVVSVMELHL